MSSSAIPPRELFIFVAIQRGALPYDARVCVRDQSTAKVGHPLTAFFIVTLSFPVLEVLLCTLSFVLSGFNKETETFILIDLNFGLEKINVGQWKRKIVFKYINRSSTAFKSSSHRLFGDALFFRSFLRGGFTQRSGRSTTG